MRLAAIVLAAASLVAAGCSSSGGGNASPHVSKATSVATSSAPSSTAPATPSTPAATTAQFASIISAGKTRVDHAAQQIADCGYEYDPTDLTCALGRQTYALTVETLSVNLEGALRPSAPHYLGRPPAELADVIATTRSALHEMRTAEDAQERRCRARATSACDGAIFNWVSAKEDVEAALAAWKPYGA